MQVIPSIVTEVDPFLKFVPFIVIVSLPVTDPYRGEILVIVGVTLAAYVTVLKSVETL